MSALLRLPLDYHGGTKRKSPAFRAVDGKAALGEGFGGDGEAEAEGVVGKAFRDLLERVTFGGGVGEVAVSANPAAPVAEDATRVMRVVTEDGFV